MIIAFIIVLSALVFAIRITLRARHEKFLSDQLLTKIGTAYFSAIIVINYFNSSSDLVLWCACFAPLFGFEIAIAIDRFCRTRAFHTVVGDSLNRTLLKMKSGKSFRQSFTEVINETTSANAKRLREMFDIVVFTQQDNGLLHSKFLSLVIREMRFADQNPHSALRRLQTLRMRIKIEEDFRRRSGQALKQVRAQSILMTGLFLAVLIFVIASFGFYRNQNLILIATFLFSIGLVWIYRGGRKLKWKV